MGAVAERDEVVIFELNVAKDEEDKKPEVPSVAVAMENVHAPEDDEI